VEAWTRSEKSPNWAAIGPKDIEGHGDQTIPRRHDVTQDEVFQNQDVSSEQTFVAREMAAIPGIDRGPVDPHQTHVLFSYIVRGRDI
jgi:hypothetical protein